MCGRFTLTKTDFDDVIDDLDAIVRPEFKAMYRPRYNIAPTDQHWILRSKYEERQLLPAKWGLVNSWAHDMKRAASQINARSESAMTNRAFRGAFAARRCVIPADGFFEWQGAKENRRPVWYHDAGGGLILFAGLYESWQDKTSGEWTRTFTILTTDANALIEPVHDRMPVVLPRDAVEQWLFVPSDEKESPKYAKSLKQLLVGAEEGVLVATPVSPRANSVKNDDPSVLEPANDREEAAAPRLL